MQKSSLRNSRLKIYRKSQITNIFQIYIALDKLLDQKKNFICRYFHSKATVACKETRRFNISNQKSGQDSFICQDTKYIDKRCLEDLKICHKFQHQNLQKSQGYYNFRLDFIYGPFSDKAVQQTQFFDKFLKTHRALRN